MAEGEPLALSCNMANFIFFSIICSFLVIPCFYFLLIFFLRPLSSHNHFFFPLILLYSCSSYNIPFLFSLLLFYSLLLYNCFCLFLLVWVLFSVVFCFVLSQLVQQCTWYGGSRTSQSANWRGKPTNKLAKNNQDPNTTGYPTWQGALLEHPAQDIKKATPLSPTGLLPDKATPWKQGIKPYVSNNVETNKE